MSDDKPDGGATTKPRPWLASYPPGMPAEVPPSPHASIADLLETSCARYAGKPAYSSMDRTLTFTALEAETRKVAAWMQGLDLVKGDRVAVMMPNILPNPVIVYAILRAGLIVVNVNPLYTPRELEHQLRDSGAKAIFVLENFACTVEKVLARTAVVHVVVVAMGDMLGAKGLLVNFVVRRVRKLVPPWSIPGAVRFSQVLRQGAARRFNPVAVAPQDIAFLQYTGGTTGTAKGATLTHANLLTNTAQLSLWLDSAFTARARPEVLTFVCALPLYHIFALTVNSLMGISLGGHNVMIANPRDIPAFVKELGKHRVHLFPGVNTLFNALMDHPDFRTLDLSSLLMVLGGGMAVHRPVAERWLALTGTPITEGYGLSETSPVASANRLDVREFSGSIGLPLPSTEIEIRDDEGHALAPGSIGEICIRGPQVMRGYWNQPEETAQAMFADGFFRSGDLGTMDEQGYTRIVDRKKDMILVSGFNVYPAEIEAVAVLHPGIVEAAAIGIANEHTGETVKLFVVKRDPSITEADVRAHCAANLTNYKRPGIIEFRDALPKSNIGKILRKDLRG